VDCELAGECGRPRPLAFQQRHGHLRAAGQRLTRQDGDPQQRLRERLLGEADPAECGVGSQLVERLG